ncbi:MAG TPA: hypothetical protein VGK90_08860 [Rhizomicrobium sp.]|jgi:hypothetical protein
MKSLALLATALAMAVSTGAATAGGGSFTGNWPLTVSRSQFLNGSYCLTVTDDGSGGWRHSGSATIPQYTFGVFQVIDGKFMADIVVPLQGQNGVLTFNADGHNGKISNGGAVLIEGGEPLDSGIMKVGAKGGC